MQRAAFDLLGISAVGAHDRRKWLRHAAWPADVFPLRKDFRRRITSHESRDHASAKRTTIPSSASKAKACTKFPSGPVHAGTIEPGHFRFSIVGEGVLRLEERLGYKHKGIEKRFEQMDLTQGARLAGTNFRRFHGGLCMGLCDGGRERMRHDAAAARAVVAGAAARARARRPASVGPGFHRQRRGARVRPGAVFLPPGGYAAHQRRAVRSPLPDGHHRARGRGARPRCRRHCRNPRRNRYASARPWRC